MCVCVSVCVFEWYAFRTVFWPTDLSTATWVWIFSQVSNVRNSSYSSGAAPGLLKWRTFGFTFNGTLWPQRAVHSGVTLNITLKLRASAAQSVTHVSKHSLEKNKKTWVVMHQRQLQHGCSSSWCYLCQSRSACAFTRTNSHQVQLLQASLRRFEPDAVWRQGKHTHTHTNMVTPLWTRDAPLTRRPVIRPSVQHLQMERAHLGCQTSSSSSSSSCSQRMLHSVRIWSHLLHPTVSVNDETALRSMLQLLYQQDILKTRLDVTHKKYSVLVFV